MSEFEGERTAANGSERAFITVGLDEGPASAAALRWAAEHSRSTGLPLRVVHAWQLSALGAAAVSSGAGDYLQAATEDARARATRWVLDALGGDSAEIRWTLDIVEGPPGPALVDRSRHAKALVLGTREHTGLRRAVVGSVSHYCLSHADAAVVAVPAEGDRQPPAGSGRGMMASPGPLL